MAGPELTPDVSGNPRVEVFFDPGDLDPDAARLRMFRLSDNRVWKVRGGVDIAVGVAALDYECPFQTQATYRAEMFAVDGASLGFTETESVVLDYTGTILHQPLVPQMFTPVELQADTGTSLIRDSDGEWVRVEGAKGGRRWIGTSREGLGGYPLHFFTTIGQADAVQAMMGDYEVPQFPVLCLRTSERRRFPGTFFFNGAPLAEIDHTFQSGGDGVRFLAAVNEAEPPFPGITTPTLTYDDLDAAYATYDERDAAYASYTEQDRDYSLAGLAG